MSYIKVVKVKESIENLNQYMNIYQAINRLDWILENKCINCEQQCTDCYLDFESKISIEKILTYLKKNKRKNKRRKNIMRDPKRITPLMTEFEKQWKRFPDWRFGQLIENIKRFYGVDDLFFIEDDKMLELIKNFMTEKEKEE